MRKLCQLIALLFLVSALSICFIANSQAQTSGLIAEWDLSQGSGNTASDSSGNAYNGVIHNAEWISSQGKTVLDFNGYSSYVDIPSLPIDNVDSLTVVAWIKSNFDKTGYIFYHGDTGEFLLHNGERFSDGSVAGRYPNIASFSIKIYSTWYDVYSAPVEANVWHQIVGVWQKGQSLKIYVDGNLSGQTSVLDGYLLNDGPSWLSSLGVYNRGAESNTYYQGLLSDVSVFSKALSLQEIKGLYNNNYLNPTPSPSPSPTQTYVVPSSTNSQDTQQPDIVKLWGDNIILYFIAGTLIAIVVLLILIFLKKKV
jgi:large repetitive protein